jgi:hypothetical protein
MRLFGTSQFVFHIFKVVVCNELDFHSNNQKREGGW